MATDRPPNRGAPALPKAARPDGKRLVWISRSTSRFGDSRTWCKRDAKKRNAALRNQALPFRNAQPSCSQDLSELLSSRGPRGGCKYCCFVFAIIILLKEEKNGKKQHGRGPFATPCDVFRSRLHPRLARCCGRKASEQAP